ncbi:MAG: class I SAM-dependent methyltransferase [archaeon]
MREINLLESNPAIKRKVEAGWRTDENKEIAKRFDREFFDGDRINGYGGYYYDGRWKKVVKKLQELYNINSESSVLDVGCGKGFLLFDLQDLIPGIMVGGLEISDYALNKSMDKYGEYAVREGIETGEVLEIERKARNKVLPFLIKGSAEKLPWPDNSFDVVLSINTIHNLHEEECKTAIKEMIRVCKPGGHMFIQVDSYVTAEDKERMDNWILTAETVKSVEEWKDFFKEAGYDGDYYWTIV